MATENDREVAAGSLLTRHIAGYLVAQAIAAAGSLLSIVIIARLLGRSDFGTFSVVIAITFAAAQFSVNWIQVSLLRFAPLAQTPAEAATVDRTLVVSLLLMVAVVMLVEAVVGGAIAFASQGVSKRLVAAAVAVTAGTMTYNALRTRAQSRLSPGSYTTTTAGNTLLRFVLPVVAVKVWGASAEAALAGVAAAYAVSIVPLAATMPAAVARREGGTAAAMRTWWGYGAAMSGWFLTLQILASADRLMLGVFRSASTAGLYSATYDLVNKGIYLPADAVALAGRPLAMRSAAQADDAGVRAIVRELTRKFLLVTVPVAVITIAYGHRVVSILLPAEFEDGARIIPVVMAGFLISHVCVFVGIYLEAGGRTRMVFAAAGVAAVANLTANVILIPLYGYMGAAVGTLISYSIQLVAIAAICRGSFASLVPVRSVATVAMGALAMLPVLAAAGRLPGDALTGAAGGSILGLVIFGAVAALRHELPPVAALRAYAPGRWSER